VSLTIGMIAVFLAIKMVTKFVGILPLTIYHEFDRREGMYTTLLMSTGLTFGTISAQYGLNAGIIDKMQFSVLAELRLLASADLDSQILLTTVLAGDGRLAERLRADEFLPLASRIRTRLRTEALAAADLLKCLQHLLEAAGNARLLTPGLQQTLCEHAAGNLRLLMNMANELFATACSQNLATLDEKLYLQVFTPEPKPAQRRLRP